MPGLCLPCTPPLASPPHPAAPLSDAYSRSPCCGTHPPTQARVDHPLQVVPDAIRPFHVPDPARRAPVLPTLSATSMLSARSMRRRRIRGSIPSIGAPSRARAGTPLTEPPRLGFLARIDWISSACGEALQSFHSALSSPPPSLFALRIEHRTLSSHAACTHRIFLTTAYHASSYDPVHVPRRTRVGHPAFSPPLRNAHFQFITRPPRSLYYPKPSSATPLLPLQTIRPAARASPAPCGGTLEGITFVDCAHIQVRRALCSAAAPVSPLRRMTRTTERSEGGLRFRLSDACDLRGDKIAFEDSLVCGTDDGTSVRHASFLFLLGVLSSNEARQYRAHALGAYWAAIRKRAVFRPTRRRLASGGGCGRGPRRPSFYLPAFPHGPHLRRA
ncbi:hypothetical protein B0H11DRAFT_2276365 [Mycena galericulata]|nr:hypothetical protein B0H11DRAFT_2276365 [Mycena galericulata]